MIQKVHAFIERHQLVPENSIVVVGVSGGPDSLALLHFFANLQKEKSIKVIAAHVDHMLRGKQSEEDLLFVEEFCKQLHIPCESIQINVKSYQTEHKVSTQVAARKCRYAFFEKVMEKYQAGTLALGHHGDDQIETILMRLVRGSSPIGYAGIQVKRPFNKGTIIRPFLCVTKDSLLDYCKKYNLQPRNDPSNEKDDYTRNRLRHHVLPYLKKENNNVHQRFQHFSEKLTEDEALLEELSIQKMNKVIKRKEPKCVVIDSAEFKTVPMPLQRRGIQLILNYLYKDISPDLSSIHIDNLLSLLANDYPSGSLHFPNGLRIVRSYNNCEFTFSEKEAEPYCYRISDEGKVCIPNGYILQSEIAQEYPSKLRGPHIFIIDPDTVELPLEVRTRKSGDKMALKGMNGTKKVKDIFIDEKIPRELRETWPIVTDAKGNILWLPLLKKSSLEAANSSKRKYIILKYKH